MEEEEVLGVNLDELSSLFSSSEFLGGRSFGWGLAPYKNVVVSPDGVMKADDSVVLYIDAFGEANLNSKMWMYQKADPLDAYVEPEFSPSNLFIRGLQKSVGVPTYGIISYPWYKVDEKGLKKIKYPDDTPFGFVPCNGYKVEVGGKEIQLPDLVSRTVTEGAGVNATTKVEYIAPPGCTMMMKLPGGIDGASSTSIFGGTISQNFEGDLVTWGNPGSPYGAALFE